MAVSCSHCGRQLAQPMPFCPNCGTGMRMPAELRSSSNILPASTPAQRQYVTMQQSSGSSPLRAFMTFGLGASGCLMLAGVFLTLTLIGATLGLPMAFVGFFGLVGFGIARAALR